MLKNFDEWNKRKKRIDFNDRTLFFRAGQIWWAHVGENIGVEVNGKGKLFLRPIIILRKYNELSLLALPLTTSIVHHDFRIPVGVVLGKSSFANASQLRYMDSRRLFKFISQIEKADFSDIKKKADEINFHPPFSL